MDRQARKLQIAREQQGHYESSATGLLNSNETGDVNAATRGNSSGGPPASASKAFSALASRGSDLTILSDDDDKEVLILTLYTNTLT